MDSSACSRKFGSKYKKIYLTCIIIALLLLLVPAVVKAEAFRETTSSSPEYINQLRNYRQEVKKEELKEQRQQKEELNEAVITHKVKPGETLNSIARQYDTDMVSLLKINDNIDNPHLLAIGQEIDILTIEGAVHRVKEGDTVDSLAKLYGVEPEEIISFNLLEESSSLPEGEKLVMPGGEFPKEERERESSRLIASRGGIGEASAEGALDYDAPEFRWPVRGEITSYYGWRNGSFHYGIDIASPYGNEVRAAYGGIADFIGYLNGYGQTLVLDHGKGWSTLYAHNKEILVSVGEEVSTGQPVARIGSSGNATGPHLHFEIKKKGEKLDPLKFLK